MRSLIARISMGAMCGVCFLSGHSSLAETGDGMNARFAAMMADDGGVAAEASPMVVPPRLALTVPWRDACAAESVGVDAISAAAAPSGGTGATPARRVLTLNADSQQNDAAESPESVMTACACGCGIFEVGTSAMFPEGQGGTVFLEYDFQNQDRNWHGSSRAPASNNPDKDIRTHFLMAGLQYMFDRQWGIQVEVPYDVRHFETTGGASGSDRVALNWGALGDVRIEGIYTGFSPDLSTGVTFGFKLPTGNFKHNDAFGDIDRDTEIGTGSTDALLGGFYRQGITAGNRWTGFAQVKADLPIFTREGYRPGMEFDGAAGLYYSGFSIGRVDIIPVGQVLVSERTSDSGANSAHPIASGYQRILLSPGVEFHFHPFMVYGDVEVPVYQDVRGNQMVAPVAFKVVLSFSF